MADSEKKSKKRQRIEAETGSNREKMLKERLSYIQPFINLKESNGDCTSVKKSNEGQTLLSGNRCFIAEGT